MQNIRTNLPGIFFCFLTALPAWLLGKHYPVIGAPVFGILAGILLTLLFPGLGRSIACSGRQLSLNPGIKYTAKKILQHSIILLGFGINLLQVLQVGADSIIIILVTLAAAFLTALPAGKYLKLDWQTTILIGVGTAVCGGSAIAAAAPVIKVEESEIARAISTIFFFNILAVLIFPTLGIFFGLSDQGFGMWAGTAINDTSSVVAAASVWSSTAGNNTALGYATIVKLTRTLMIIPITLILALFMTRKNHGSNNFSFTAVFPWFILGFLLTSLCQTIFNLGPLSLLLAELGKFFIVPAMVAIGLNTDLKKILKSGLSPLLLGLFCWVVVALTSLLAQKLLHFW